MAFTEGGKGTKYIPTCHGCDRKCKGNWRKCQHITKDHKSKVAALDGVGHFRCGNNNNNSDKSKKGTVNVVAGAGKDDSGDKSGDEATKAKNSSASELIEDMTVGELLGLTRIVNTTVGMSEVDGEIYEEDGSWDGDVLANISVGFCQLQGEKPVKVTVVNEEWLVQGRRRTNPLKVKIKTAKSEGGIFVT